MPEHDPQLIERARRTKLLLMDVDGVLTDGRISWVPRGDDLEEVKSFHVADGAGIVLAHRVGLHTGIISARESRVVAERMRDLGVEEVHMGVKDKAAVLDEVIQLGALPVDQIAYVGDDVVDLPAMLRVGFPIAVANASEDVKRQAAYVTRAEGGHGAIREVIELILKAQGKWEGVINEFLSRE